jgi:hypothetical protein
VEIRILLRSQTSLINALRKDPHRQTEVLAEQAEAIGGLAISMNATQQDVHAMQRDVITLRADVRTVQGDVTIMRHLGIDSGESWLPLALARRSSTTGRG